jgi:RHS repeat-associated protein
VDDGNPCTSDSCDPASGVAHVPLAAGTACADADLCNGDETCNASGTCVAGTPPTVGDGNPCTDDTCDPSTGVAHDPVAAGTACADADLCNGDETCDGSGTCAAGTAPVMDDGNPCTTDTCSPATGVAHSPVAAGTTCADADLCNGGETCNESGVCVAGTPPTIDDDNPCTADSCDPATGVAHTPVAAGTACADADICNGDETCDGNGTCSAGTPPVVDDQNACTTDSCDPSTGVAHAPAPAGTDCGDGRFCDGSGSCQCPPGACCAPETTSILADAFGDPTVATDFVQSVAPLYLGTPAHPEPQQHGATVSFDPMRIAAVLGHLRDRDTGAPVGCAMVTVAEEAGFGYTYTLADGSFTMAVMATAVADGWTLRFDAPGYISAFRKTSPEAHDYTILDDVELVPAEPLIDTTVTSGSSTVTTVEAPLTADETGERSAKISFPSGTYARLPDGSAMSGFKVGITEITLGENRMSAMPALLPPDSAYTYAVDLSVEGAEGQRVSFTDSSGAPRTVHYYLDNFIGFPTGEPVPTGYYDDTLHQWVAVDSGRVIQIVGIDGNGRALLDVDTSAGADSDAVLATLGITNEERIELARLYGPVANLPKSIWRVQLGHFSVWDMNWGFGPPDDADSPPGGPDEPGPGDPPPCDPERKGSIIGCASQTLSERIPVAGTPFSLVYNSRQQRGSDRRVRIPVAVEPATLPTSLRGINLDVSIAGKKHSFHFARPAAGSPPLWLDFTWDGRDGFGRPVMGSQLAQIDLAYVYQASYERTERFGYNGNGVVITGARSRMDLSLHKHWTRRIENWDRLHQGFGGWSVDIHHAFDPVAKQIVPGVGRMQQVEGSSRTLRTIAGTGTRGSSGDGGPALQATINLDGSVNYNHQIVEAPDGTVYFTDTQNNRVRAIAPNGNISTVATLSGPIPGLAYGDGGLFMSDPGSHRVRFLKNGVMTVVAGGGSLFTDGIPATQANLNAPHGLAYRDGALYIADLWNYRIVKVVGGILTTVAGNRTNGNPVFGSPAKTSPIRQGAAVAVGPQGSVYFVQGGYARVLMVGTDGILREFAGNGSTSGAPNFGDNGPATLGNLWIPDGLVAADDGNVYIVDKRHHAIRRVSPQGILDTVVGVVGLSGYSAADEGAPATSATLNEPRGMGISADGSLYIADTLANRIRKADPVGVDLSTSSAVPSSDGTVIFHFLPDNRHDKTTDAFTGETIYQFSYDPEGRLSGITDGFGRTTAITHGTVTTIAAPDGQQTELAFTGGGYLRQLVDPAGEAYTFTYSDDGLLTSMLDPKANAEGGNAYVFGYAEGRLTTDRDPLGNVQTLSYEPETDTMRVVHGTPLGRETTYEQSSSSDARHIVQTTTDGAGVADRVETRTDLGRSFASADAPSDVRYSSFRVNGDGSAEYYRMAPDPRFGLQAPFVSETKRMSRADGSGVESVSTVARSYTVAADGLSVTSMTETTTTNGRVGTSTFQRNGGGTGLHRWVTTSPAGRTSSRYVDGQGLLTRAEVSGLYPTHFAYDAAGRLIHVARGTDADCADPDLTVSTPTCRRMAQSYFGSEAPTLAGYLKQVLDASGVATEYSRDPLGRSLSETRAGASAAYGWDANSNLVAVTPPGKPTHGMTYTPVNLLASYDPPAAGLPVASTSYTNDADRMLAAETRPTGAVVSGSYDAAGRLDTVSFPGGLVDYDYVPAGTSGGGHPSQILGPYGVNLALTYGGPYNTSVTWSGAVSGSVAWGYNVDLIKSRETVTAGGSSQVAYFGYDSDLLLTCASPTTCSPAGSDALVLGRSAQHGLVTSITRGATNETWTYNGYGELARQTARYNTTTLYDVTYHAAGAERDALGRVTRKTEVVDGSTRVSDYDYDDLGRLTSVTLNGALAEEYTYDLNGNRLTAFSPATGTLSATYDDQDRLLTYGPWTFTYTANGELATKTNTATSESWTYQYDVLGNLLSVSLPDGDLVEYLVDGLGRRVGKKLNGTLVRQWLYRNALKPAVELDGAGNLVARFVYGSKANVPDLVIRGGATYRVVSDQLGSPVLAVNVADADDVPFRAEYSAFGEVTGTGIEWMPFGFAGGMYDADTGLVRFGARDYDPQTGRWTRKEPLRFAGSLNFYFYSANDPVNLLDPTGLAVTHAGITFEEDSQGRLIVTNEIMYKVMKDAKNALSNYSRWSGPGTIAHVMSKFDTPFRKMNRQGVCDRFVYGGLEYSPDQLNYVGVGMASAHFALFDSLPQPIALLGAVDAWNLQYGHLATFGEKFWALYGRFYYPAF